MLPVIQPSQPFLFRLLVLIPLLVSAAFAAAQDKPEQTLNEAEFLDEFVDMEMSRKCISLRRVDNTEVLSNQSIVFEMRGDAIYINRLRYRCPGLSRRDTIMYETRSSQLCNLDQITVLDDIGGRFMRGARCGLGDFHPIDQDTLDLLKGNLEQRRKVKRGRGQIE